MPGVWVRRRVADGLVCFFVDTENADSDEQAQASPPTMEGDMKEPEGPHVSQHVTSTSDPVVNTGLEEAAQASPPTMEREGMVSFSAWLRRKARGLYSDRPGRQWLMHQLEVCPLVCVGKNECVQGAVDQ